MGERRAKIITAAACVALAGPWWWWPWEPIIPRDIFPELPWITPDPVAPKTPPTPGVPDA